ncbi:MAG: F0F1 ATP synthase subunit A [Candidatus Doudnabacteria bacterium]|nr:F0F1 ATP synthase subunit A [Candidatus Doudnabacteria bacterium]
MLSLPPLAAESLFHIGSFPITNSYVNSTLGVLAFAVFAFFLNRSAKKYYAFGAPKGLVNFFESILEFVLGYIDSVTKDRKKTMKFLPLVGGMFFFILFSNWIGLLPGTGSIGINRAGEFLPLLRPANTDLNMTLAMAVFAVIASHILGIAAIGFFKYANKFIKLGDLYTAAKSLNPVKMLVAFIEFFVGLIEVFSEIAKMVSLSLRLFGNIFAGEVLLTVLASLISGYGAFLIPLPFMLLELIVGIVQATVFAMLTLVYLSIATSEIHGHAEEGHEKIEVSEVEAI